MNNTAVWIVVAVVAVIVLAGLVFAARSRRNQRRHVEAEQMREELTTHVEKADKRQTIADETAAKARAAQAEAEAKAAEAARLQQQAAGHHEAVAASREEIEERRRHADMLDPKTRVDDDADDQHGRRAGPPRRPKPRRRPEPRRPGRRTAGGREARLPARVTKPSAALWDGVFPECGTARPASGSKCSSRLLVSWPLRPEMIGRCKRHAEMCWWVSHRS